MAIKKPPPIRTRILAALGERRGEVPYDQLLRAVFPEDQFPNAFRYQSHGGPPGCAMSFRRAMNALEKDGLVRREFRDHERFSLRGRHLG